MIRNFLYQVCRAKGDWTMEDYCRTAIAAIREKVGDGKVLLALSGGVDSSVAAALLAEAVGKQLTCVFVDHGLMRLHEGRRGGSRLCQVGHPFPPRGRRVPLPPQTGWGGRAGAQAEDHRRGVHPGL